MRAIGRAWPAETRALLVLAWPTVLNRVGLLLLVAVDTIMVGGLGAQETAAFAAASAQQFLLLAPGTGFLVGTAILVSQATGAGRAAEAGRIWRCGLVLATLLGVGCGLVLLAGTTILRTLGQDPAVAVDGGRVMRAFAPGMVAIFVFAATTLYLEATERPRIGMWVSLGANVVNVAGNWVLIHGQLGLPALGAEGAIWSTTGVRVLMALVVVGAVLASARDRQHFQVIGGLAGALPVLGKLVRLGLPLAAATALETSCFATMAIIAGWIGAPTLAAWQILVNINAVCFMLAVGLASATGVRVGLAVGRRDLGAVRRAGWIGPMLCAGLLSVIGLGLWVFDLPVLRLYTADPLVLAVALPVVPLLALMLPFDGWQGTLNGALRGIADTLGSTVIFAIAFWGLGVPLGWWLGWKSGEGLAGVFTALTIAVCVASLLLAGRFHARTRVAVAIY